MNGRNSSSPFSFRTMSVRCAASCQRVLPAAPLVSVLPHGHAYETYRWYLPFSGGNSEPGSFEIQFRKVDCCRLNSPDLSLGSTQLRMSFFCCSSFWSMC